MTLLAIISDVHADAAALADALIQIEERGCSRIVCAGDLVDYGEHPNETLELLQQNNIPCIRGNHERWKLTPRESTDRQTIPLDISTEGWLSNESLKYIERLPAEWDETIEGVRVAVRHARPYSDMVGIYPDDVALDELQLWLEQVSADVLIVGHTHIPFALTALGGGLLINPGALLRTRAPGAHYVFDKDLGQFQPVQGQPGGTFGILDLPSGRFTVHCASDGSEVAIQRRVVGVTDRRPR